MDSVPLHDALKAIAWLQGTWRTSSAVGEFPTIKPFTFCEEIQFNSIGQPMFNYVAQSWNPKNERPMHRETGFLKVFPGTNKVSLILAHSFGLTTIEEGEIGDKQIKLKSTGITRLSEGCKDPAVLEIRREFTLVGDQLRQVVCMATGATTEITEHLRTVYTKVNQDEKNIEL